MSNWERYYERYQQEAPDVTILSKRHVRAKAQHKCWQCSVMIEPGECYVRIAYLDEDNKFHCVRQHSCCEV